MINKYCFIWLPVVITLLYHLLRYRIAKIMILHLCELSYFSHIWFCNLMDCSLPNSLVHRILQARILEWIAMPSPGHLPDPGIKPTSLLYTALAGKFFTTRDNQEAQPMISCIVINILWIIIQLRELWVIFQYGLQGHSPATWWSVSITASVHSK